MASTVGFLVAPVSNDTGERFEELLASDELVQGCTAIMDNSLQGAQARGLSSETVGQVLSRESFLYLGSHSRRDVRITSKNSHIVSQNKQGEYAGYHLDCYRVLMDAGVRSDLTYIVSDTYLESDEGLPPRRMP